MCFVDHLVKAIERFEKAFRIDKKNEETLENLAYLYSFRRMYQTGLKYGSRAVQYNPKSAAAHVVCGMLYTRRKEFEKAHKAFSTAFLLMTEEERHPYDDISPLLDPDERDLYLSSSDVKRQDWSRRFWMENDPTPATEINERALEHYARVAIADRALSDERRNARGSATDRGAALIRFGLPDRTLYDLGGGTSGGWIVWQYAHSKSSFNLYFNDEFLNGDYHFPISDYYGTMSLKMLDSVPQRYVFPVEYRPFPASLAIAELRGGDERTRIEMSVAIPDSLKRTPGLPWDIFVTFFDSQWNRLSRDRITFKPDSLPVIQKANGRFLVCNFAIEMLPRPLECTCIVEIVSEKDRRKASRRNPIEIRELRGRSLKLSSVKFTHSRSGGVVLDDPRSDTPVPRERRALPLLRSLQPAGRRKRSVALSFELFDPQAWTGRRAVRRGRPENARVYVVEREGNQGQGEAIHRKQHRAERPRKHRCRQSPDRHRRPRKGDVRACSRGRRSLDRNDGGRKQDLHRQRVIAADMPGTEEKGFGSFPAGFEGSAGSSSDAMSSMTA